MEDCVLSSKERGKLKVNMKEVSPKKFESLCASQQHQKLWGLINRLSENGQQDSWHEWYQQFWWEPVKVASVELRRRNGNDLGFLRSLWQDQDWLDQFHPSAKQLPTSDSVLSNLLTNAYNHSILENKCVHWVGESGTKPVALVSIVNISLDNRRGELLMGVIPGTSPFISTRLALLALKFWFENARMQKLTSLIRHDNAHSIRSTLHLGFEQEGVLKEHLYDNKTKSFIDLHCFGLSRTQAFQRLKGKLFQRLS